MRFVLGCKKPMVSVVANIKRNAARILNTAAVTRLPIEVPLCHGVIDLPEDDEEAEVVFG